MKAHPRSYLLVLHDILADLSVAYIGYAPVRPPALHCGPHARNIKRNCAGAIHPHKALKRLLVCQWMPLYKLIPVHQQFYSTKPACSIPLSF